MTAAYQPRRHREQSQKVLAHLTEWGFPAEVQQRLGALGVKRQNLFERRFSAWGNAAALLRLNGRSGYRCVGAEHAAVAFLGFEDRAAGRAVIEVLAGIDWHDRAMRVAALRARQDRLKYHLR